jgi:hypothetical protein
MILAAAFYVRDLYHQVYFMYLIVYTYHNNFFINSLADIFRLARHLPWPLDHSLQTIVNWGYELQNRESSRLVFCLAYYSSGGTENHGFDSR